MRLLSRAERVRALAAVAVVGLVTSACGGDGDAGVTIAKVSSDVAFGAKTDVDLPAPANFNPEPLTSEEAGADLELPDQYFTPVPTAAPRPALRVADDPCPEAALDEFPDQSAPVNVPMEPFGLPPEGSYRWKKGGTLESADTAGYQVEVSGFERRLVRNVEVVSETKDEATGERTAATFTFETVQPDIDGTNIVVTTYQVKTNGRSARNASENAVPVGDADESTYSAGEPERGLVVKRIEVVDRQGARVSLFEPPVGLLLLPLRVATGERFRSTTTDLRSGRRMEIDAKVTTRDRIDACGEIMEGWRVESRLTSSGRDGSFVRDYSYLVAPQYGAILLHERISQPGDDEDLQLEYTIGQQEPDPLPAGEEGGS